MLSVITGGRDVIRSAERAPFDRLAVGEIAATNSPDPHLVAGADGRPSVPNPDVAGAKCDGATPSSVGPASQAPGYSFRQSRRAVTYSPWTVRPNSSFRSTYP
jgi:hypothetical protein